MDIYIQIYFSFKSFVDVVLRLRPVIYVVPCCTACKGMWFIFYAWGHPLVLVLFVEDVISSHFTVNILVGK